MRRETEEAEGLDTRRDTGEPQRGPRLVAPLGEAPYGVADGRVGLLNALAASGLPVSGGVVLTKECHALFAEVSGLSAELRAGATGDPQAVVAALRRRYCAAPVGEPTRHVVREAVMSLGARTVAVISDHGEKRGLRTIPETMDAVVAAWLSPEGLTGQLEAAARGEELSAWPLWPVLISREERAL